MDHRDFIASLSKEQRRALTRRRDAPGLRRLGGYLIAVATIAALIHVKITLWPLLLPVLGVLLVFSFTLMHEATHLTVFKSANWNRVTAAVCGFVLALPSIAFRHFHFAHHRYTHQPDADPELLSPKPVTARGMLFYLSGLPLWWRLVRSLVLHGLGRVGESWVPEEAHNAVVREARIMLLGYCFIAIASFVFQSSAALIYWIIPIILGQPFLRFYLLAEHTLCESSDDMFTNTRTIYTGKAVRWLTWNMPYHAEHHALPGVPFHQLPALNALAGEHLRVTADGYTGFGRELRSSLRRS